jgi:hypothetical protein
MGSIPPKEDWNIGMMEYWIEEHFVCMFVNRSNASLHQFRSCHSRESGNPAEKYWIPGHARNDKQSKGTVDAVH